MSFLDGIRLALRGIGTDRSVFSTMILAVVLYGFFYPAAYRGQIVLQMPVVVVDQDNSALSRKIVEKASAVRAVRIAYRTPTFSEARDRVMRREADAILLIPGGLEASALRGKPGGVALYLSGAYLLRTREVGAGLGGAIAGAAKEVLEPITGVLYRPDTVNLAQVPLFNPSSGYGSYVVPAVAGLIVQQTLLLGVAMLVCRLVGGRGQRFSFAGFVGFSLVPVIIGFLGCLYFFGFVFWQQDYPRGGNLGGMLIASAVFAVSVVMLAILLGTFFDRPERPAQVITFTSVPFFLLSGASWPLSAMPSWLACGAWLVPSTPGIHVFVQLNQMGSTLKDVAPEILGLVMLASCFGAIACWRVCRKGDDLNHA